VNMRFSAAALALLFLYGCAAAPPVVREPRGENPQPAPSGREANISLSFSEKLRVWARESERKGDRHKALFLWQAAQNFMPDDPEISERIKALNEWIRAEAERHFQRGLDHFQKNALNAARREFLTALVFYPGHEQALYYLHNKVSEPEYLLYRVKKGDTLGKIAKEIYNAAERDFIISYFNNIKPSTVPVPGNILKLPLMEQEPKAKARKVEKAVNKAVVDKAAAESHYQNGVRYFLAEQLQDAIKEWEKALRLDPEHPHAKRDIEKARRLLDRLGS
jgi:tetratricopeptide (TPR) repeat protein